MAFSASSQVRRGRKPGKRPARAARAGDSVWTEWLAALAAVGPRAVFRRYDHDRYNVVTHRWDFAAEQLGRPVVVGDSRWRVRLTCEAVAGRSGAYEVTVQFECVSGRLEQASVGVDLGFEKWSADNYVLLPAAAYNGNRFLARKIPYSPKLYYVQDIGPDRPMIITDVPRLNLGPGVSRIQERSGSMSVPAVGFHDGRAGRGFLLLSEQANELGDLGLGIEESRDRSQAVISLTAPVVRELHNYRICDHEHPSMDRPKDFQAGDRVGFRFRVETFAAPEVQGLFDRFAVVRKELAGAAEFQPVLPYSACFELMERKFNRDNFEPRAGYYSVGPRQNFLQDWQIGWTGGMISTYPLLFAGNARTRKNVERNFDWLFPNGIAPSGFFWDAGAHGTEWIGGDIRKPHTGNWHLIRKTGDAVYYILKQFRLMEQQGQRVKPAWRNGLRRVCEALVKLWETHGQFGQFVHSLEGSVCVGGSTSGAIIPAALAGAAEYYEAPRYLKVAVAAGEHFYREFTRRGMSCGGPGDAVQNPDSESWYALIESYVALSEATGKRVWLTRAAETARQFATWVVAYNFQFPASSTFGRAGIRSLGSVYANTQNKHSAPGLCTFSGLGLFKLFRATDDRFPLELLRDIAFGLPQYLPHPERPLGGAKPGWMCERVNLTDWEGPERIGETLGMTTWAETSLLLTTIEIPGLYVQPDRSLVVAFDHVTAETVGDTKGELTVRVTNPTRFPARVRVYAESHRAARERLPENYLYGGREERFQPGETRTLTFTKA